jgi:AraC-like DNA-binding protein
MTFTKAKRELKNYRRLLKEIANLEEEIELLKSRATKITSTLSDMPRSNYNEHRMEAVMADLADDEKRYIDLLEKERLVKRIIESKINKVEKIDYNYSLLLNKRYVQGKSVIDISSEMQYSERHTKRLINLAIVEYAKI